MIVMQSTRADAKDLFVRATAATRRMIEGIRPDQWENATPCSEWDLRALVNHVTGEGLWIEQFFTGKTMAEVGDSLNGDILGDDPIAAYAAAIETALPHITDAALEWTYGFSFGELSGLGYLTQMFGDQLVHTWDIAKGSNQPAALDDELVKIARPIFEELVAFVGQGSVYGVSKAMEAESSPLASLLGLLGRSVDWQPPTGATFR